MLIGADLYGSLLLKDLRQGPFGSPTTQLTVLGWILSGPTGVVDSRAISASVLNCVSCEDMNALFQKFWEDETVSTKYPLTEEEEKCEQHFLTNYARTPSGRYIVRLPFKNGSPPQIGETLKGALSLHSKLERQLFRHPNIAAQYHEFLLEYEAMGHMQPLNDLHSSPSTSIYIPHDFVMRDSSATTKLRVVFNASARSSNGKSLNECLLIGPKLQQNIAAILLRWRQCRYVYTADIAKMFRQILVHADEVDFQRIVWRPSDQTSVKHYRLFIVTYGMASAPYLAMRVLRQLAADEGRFYPAAVPIFENCIYVDDTLFGADDIVTLREIRSQVIALMSRGGFHLRK